MLLKYVMQKLSKMRRKSRKHTVENNKPCIEPVINLDKPVNTTPPPLAELELFTAGDEPVWTLESEQELFSPETAVKDKPESNERFAAQQTVPEQEIEQEKQYEASSVIPDVVKPTIKPLNRLKINSGSKRKVSADRLKERQALRKKQLLENKIKAQQVEPAKPEPAKPEPAKPEPAKPEPAKPEPAKPEPLKLDFTGVEISPQGISTLEVIHQIPLEFSKPLTTEDFSGYSDDKIIAVPDEESEVGDDEIAAAWSDIYLEHVAKQQGNELEFSDIPNEVFNWDESTLVDDEQDINSFQGGALSSRDRAWQLASKIAVANQGWTNEDSEVLVSALLKHNNHWRTQRALTRLIDEYGATSGEIGALLEMRNAWKNSHYTRVFKFGGSAVEGWPNLSWRLGLGVLRLLDAEDSTEGMFFIEDCFDDWSCSPKLMKGYPCFAAYLSHIVNHFRRLSQKGIYLLPYADLASAWLIEDEGEDGLNNINIRQDLGNYGLLSELPDHSPWPHVSDQLTAEDYAEAIAK